MTPGAQSIASHTECVAPKEETSGATGLRNGLEGKRLPRRRNHLLPEQHQREATGTGRLIYRCPWQIYVDRNMNVMNEDALSWT